MSTITTMSRACSPTTCSHSSTSGRRPTTGRTGSSTRTGRSSATRGYLTAALPTELRRAGPRPRRGTSRLQSRLGYYAPATALGVNMHIYWTGVAADLAEERRRLAASSSSSGPPQGEVFARAPRRGRQRHARCCCRSARAERVDGGWKINGHKIFGSLTPGVDARRLPRDGHLRPGGAADRPRVRRQGRHGPRRSSTRGTRSACGPPRARTPCSTTRSCPTS